MTLYLKIPPYTFCVTSDNEGKYAAVSIAITNSTDGDIYTHTKIITLERCEKVLFYDMEREMYIEEIPELLKLEEEMMSMFVMVYAGYDLVYEHTYTVGDDGIETIILSWVMANQMA